MPTHCVSLYSKDMIFKKHNNYFRLKNYPSFSRLTTSYIPFTCFIKVKEFSLATDAFYGM